MTLARFLRDSRGGIAPMLALAALPLMGGVGAAVDFTRANATRTAFQTALDSTALMLSRDAANSSTTQIQSSATAYFTALFNHPEAKNVSIEAVYTAASTTTGSKVTLNGTASVTTNFLGVFGYSQLPITAKSESTWGNTRLRVALVLDNTGSMASDSKMDALKTAAKNLLNQLKSAAVTEDDVYVSIVPFSKDVNIGSSNYAQSWVRWDLWEEDNGTCSNTSYKSKTSCTSHNKTWTAANHNTWNGCLTDRDQNYDTLNTAPGAGATLFPAEQYSSCPVELMGLSNNWTSLTSKIEAMQPSGNTNQAIGLQMGWQTLTASPFTVPAMDPNYKYTQVIILLTDGLNTQDRWYSYASQIDAREQKTCDNIKAAGITLYTVQVNTGNDPTSTLLKGCATDTSKFFLLTSSTQIVTTFAQIGTALSNLRLSM